MALAFLDRDRSIAPAGYSRWLVPPAALAIHLCIGQVYAFSVFKIPLTQALGINKSASGDWSQSQLAWIFSLAIVMLGLSAAAFGKWLEGAGPRRAMIGSPLAIKLMAYFRNGQDVGVGKTFLVMGVLYFLLMMFGVFTIRVPQEDWKPLNWTAPIKEQKLITTHNVDVNTAFMTPQF